MRLQANLELYDDNMGIEMGYISSNKKKLIFLLKYSEPRILKNVGLFHILLCHAISVLGPYLAKKKSHNFVKNHQIFVWDGINA